MRKLLSREKDHSKIEEKNQQAQKFHKRTQAQLAQKVNVKQNIINDYEDGKAVPDNAL